MLKFLLTVFFLVLFSGAAVKAQSTPVPYATHTTEKNRSKEYRNLINSINKNLSYSLSDSTEEFWQDAFYALELLAHRSPWVDNRVRTVFDSITNRTYQFQRAFLELIYTNYQNEFTHQLSAFVQQTTHPKLLAMAAEYLLLCPEKEKYATLVLNRVNDLSQTLSGTSTEPFFTVLQNRLKPGTNKTPPLADLINNSKFRDEIVLFSFQRKNRNYPGLAMVKGKDGIFIKEEQGNYFSVPQLARSMSNMPGYLTNGNTPQGIFKMTGFDVSKSSFIGPTINIQMIMPFEISEGMPDSIAENFGKQYTALLPPSWQKHEPIYEAYYAGLAGRTEIIAHGTTVNPNYYLNKPYYPISPTQGCLCTKEIWSTADGRRLESDQQKLVDVLTLAGGAVGYCIVVELDDQQKPVSLNELLPFIK